MNLTTLLIFLPACFALNMAPGPNNLLSINNATRYGFRKSCLAGIGRLFAFTGMITLAAAGLVVVLQTSELIFYGIKFLGALYLLYLAYQLWISNPSEHVSDRGSARGLFALARQEFFVAAGNPKAILIFTAFLPQFVDTSRSIGPQFAILGLLFLALEWVALAAYAFIGLNMQRWLTEPKGKRIFNRGCALLLSGAAALLLMARRP